MIHHALQWQQWSLSSLPGNHFTMVTIGLSTLPLVSQLKTEFPGLLGMLRTLQWLGFGCSFPIISTASNSLAQPVFGCFSEATKSAPKLHIVTPRIKQ